MLHYRHHRQPHRDQGFTLIELLVVVVIVSISISIVVMKISGGSEEDLAENEIQKLQQLLRFAHTQSVVRSQEYGLRFYKTGYRFMIYDENTKLWVDLNTDKLLRARSFPEPLELDLYINQLSVDLLDSSKDDPKVEEKEEEEEESELAGPLSTQKNKTVNTATGAFSIRPNAQNSNTVVIKPQVFLLSSSELEPQFELRLRVPGSDIEEYLYALPQGEYTRKAPDE
ncbi:MAG TPA: type II secretion system protein GspH [Gammaproteobacteria bacterium]|nr:type II secretion system protein GspH [Gammaproteobacteria bacterium]